MTPDELRTFLFAVIGSVAVEMLIIVRAYETGRPLPVRYRRPVFLLSRSLLAAFAGALAVAYQPRNDLLAVHIGVATPAILLMFSRPPAE